MLIRESNGDGNGKENVKKAIGLDEQITTLHVHHVHYISLPSLRDNDVKFPQVAFYGEPKHKTTTFSFSLKTWVQPLRLQFGKVQLYLRFYATRNNREKV